MNKFYPWGANPGHKIFEIILAKHNGYDLVKHGRYVAEKFGSEEIKVIQKGLEELPDRLIKKLYLKILEQTEGPPREYPLKQFKLSARNEPVPVSYSIMGDPECLNLITGLSMMQMKPNEIIRHVNTLPFPPEYRIEHVSRFCYQFWNVSEKEGWTHQYTEYLRSLIQSDSELKESFEHLLAGALSKKSRREIALHYNLTLSPSDRSHEMQRSCDLALGNMNQHLEAGDAKMASSFSGTLQRNINIGAAVGVDYQTVRSVLPTILPEN